MQQNVKNVAIVIFYTRFVELLKKSSQLLIMKAALFAEKYYLNGSRVCFGNADKISRYLSPLSYTVAINVLSRCGVCHIHYSIILHTGDYLNYHKYMESDENIIICQLILLFLFTYNTRLLYELCIFTSGNSNPRSCDIEAYSLKRMVCTYKILTIVRRV